MTSSLYPCLKNPAQVQSNQNDVHLLLWAFQKKSEDKNDNIEEVTNFCLVKALSMRRI